MNQLYNGCPYPPELKAVKRTGKICDYIDAEKVVDALLEGDCELVEEMCAATLEKHSLLPYTDVVAEFLKQDALLTLDLVTRGVESGEWDSEIAAVFTSGKAKCPRCNGDGVVEGDHGEVEPCPVCAAE